MLFFVCSNCSSSAGIFSAGTAGTVSSPKLFKIPCVSASFCFTSFRLSTNVEYTEFSVSIPNSPSGNIDEIISFSSSVASSNLERTIFLSICSGKYFSSVSPNCCEVSPNKILLLVAILPVSRLMPGNAVSNALLIADNEDASPLR